MAFLDDTVVGIAFPNIVRSFPSARLSELSWVLNAYNIGFAALMVPAGRFADLVGRRRMFRAGIVMFWLGSALCAVAPSLGALIAARGVQGLGAAVIVPASLAIVLHGYPARERAVAVAIWSATAAVAAGAGPSIGGALVDIYNWRLVFLVNLPVGVAAWWLAGRQLVESRAPGQRASPDLLGALSLAVAVGALSLTIVQGQSWGWASLGVLSGAVVTAIAGAVVAVRSWRHPAPVIDVELVRTHGFALISTVTLVGGAGFFSLGLANVLFMIEVWGYSPLQAGLATTPAPFLAAVTAGLAGRLALRVDPRRVVLVGAVAWTAGPLLLLARATSRPEFLGVYLPAAALLAVGIGLAFPLVSDAAVAAAPSGRYAGATALNGAIRQVGAALGVAVLAALLGHPAGRGAVHQFHASWVFASACFGLVACGALLLPAFRPLNLGTDQDLALRRAGLPMHERPRPRSVGRSRGADAWRLAGTGGDSNEALLSEVAMLAGVPPTARRGLAEQCQTVRLTAGEWLFHEGEAADALYIVRSGRLGVWMEHDDRPAELLRELGRGSIVGELALLTAGARSASIKSHRDAVLLRLHRGVFSELMEGSAHVASAVSRTLAAQLQHSRLLDTPAVSPATTFAVVRAPADRRGASLEARLRSELSHLGQLAWLDQERLEELVPDTESGVALAHVLDRLESEHEFVILSAAAAPGDPWLRACLRQSDRTVLVVDPIAAPSPRWTSEEQLRGCDMVFWEEAAHPVVAELQDRLVPRSMHRVRGDADVSRLARRIAGRSVGLVLSGGGARGFAHIGVIEELQAAGITIDRIGGASMGAFVGALLAQEMDADEIDARCYREWVRRNPLGDYRFPRTSISRGARARTMLERNLPGLIEDLPRSYYCVTTDIIAAELVVHRRGEIATAVGASMCLPGIVPPVPLGQRLLVDGGVLDNLPVSTMVEQAEGPVIASDVTEPEQRTLAPDESPPNVGLIDTIARVMLLGTTDTEALGRRRTALYIKPDNAFVGRLEFHMLDQMRDAGRRAAVSALETAPSELFG